MRRTGSALFAAGLAVTIVTTAGCGSSSEATETAPPAPADLAALDVGNLRTDPKVYGKVTSLEQAKAVEAMRMGNYVALPMEIDPEVTVAPPAMSGAIRLFTDFGSTVIKGRMRADPSRLSELTTGFISGFVSTGQSNVKGGLSYELDNVVMLFDTELDARTAANVFADEEFGTDSENQPIELGKYPSARAQVNPGSPGMLQSWYAVGRFVIATYIYDNVMSALETADSAKLISRAETSIDKISDSLKEYEPLRLDELMDSEIDMDGVLGLVLPTVTDDGAQRGIPGVYNRHGGLHLSGSPAEDAVLFEETGVDRIAWQGNFVHRARDEEAAQRIAEEHGKVSKFLRRVESPQGLPNAQCTEYVGPAVHAIKYYCTVSFGRYAAEVAASQLTDVHQRISAQYAILAKSK
ncbi:DUF7373 family lipoprotein [Nocardia mangyaensis]|uniref:DUF7373 family lipoprotein n=1 Tax=Nocardia mangyaensis TaxID=2213200 RepID=UPI0026752DE5|nr:hypothetical protein [Nocardia mangyaensis]MDO3647246.1 hypothetical protein [Nocardia mangyaensis]